jgi:hypothetical protein
MNVLKSSFSLTKPVGVGVSELKMTLLEVGAGSGSLEASMQYDFPVSNLPHSAVMEGFYSQSELSVFGIVKSWHGKRLPIV